MLSDSLRRLGIDPAPLQNVNWAKWILILISIGAVAYIGLNAPRIFIQGRNGFELFMVLLLFLIVAALIFYRVELGVLAIVLTSFFVRFTLPTGSASQLPASLLISGFIVLVWCLSMLLRRQVRLVSGNYVAPTLIFILICLFSVPYSWIILTPDLFGHGGSGSSGLGFSFVQVGGVTLMILLPAVMLMTANVFKKESWFKILFGIMIAVAIPELLMRFGIFRFNFFGFSLRTGASYALWVVALSMGQAYFNTSLKPYWRVGLVLLSGIYLYYGAELGATWFSGWMPAAVALLFLTFVYSRKLFLILFVLGLVIFISRPDFYIDHIWNDAVSLDSNRFEIWSVIIFDLTLTKTNLFFGAGPAGYLPFYEKFYPGAAWVSHNNYVDIFAEVGIIGFSVFLWMLAAIFFTGWKQRNQMRTPFLKGFNYGVLGGFCGTLFAMGLGDWHIPFVYNIGIPGFDIAVFGWLLTGAMLALNHMRAVPESINA